MNDAALLSPLNQVPVNLLTSHSGRLETKLASVQAASGARQKAELKKVSEEFEAVFIAQLLKVMRETIEDSGLLGGGFGKSIYTELFDQEVSLSLSRKGMLGISNILHQSLSARIDGGDEPESGKAPVSDRTGPPDAGNNPEEEISDFQLPVRAPVSSAFGMRRDPFSHQAKFHKGLDLAAPEGMKVVPAMEGKIVFAGHMNGYGNIVIVQHANELQTRYGHLGSIAVRVGDSVDSQDILGTVGITGRSTGPHLHFEVIRNGVAVDPLEHLNASIPGAPMQNLKTGV